MTVYFKDGDHNVMTSAYRSLLHVQQRPLAARYAYLLLSHYILLSIVDTHAGKRRQVVATVISDRLVVRVSDSTTPIWQHKVSKRRGVNKQQVLPPGGRSLNEYDTKNPLSLFNSELRRQSEWAALRASSADRLFTCWDGDTSRHN